jgi:threonine dehydratase
MEDANRDRVTITDIRLAAQCLAGHILRTPTLRAAQLSAMTGAEIFVKYENMQATGSFKERGALCKLMSLTKEEKARGVIAMSAGNHAQAVAFHAASLGIPATIVMPKTTPAIKIANTRAYGAEVILEGETLAESEATCRAAIASRKLILVHPYDDSRVIAGQGTIAFEMLADFPDLDQIVVPIGGGGLVSGMAIAVKALRPQIEIIGVEAALYPSFHNELTGENRPCGGATLAEGIAVKNVGRLTLPIIREHVSSILLVGESELERAVNGFASHQHALAEGAGAAGLAAILANPARFGGKRVGLVLSGGNIDTRVLASIMVRELEREDRIVSFRLTLADRPGLLGDLATRIGAAGANILEVSHRRLMLDVPARGVSVDFTIETRDREHAESILQALAAEGLTPHRLISGRDNLLAD